MTEEGYPVYVYNIFVDIPLEGVNDKVRKGFKRACSKVMLAALGEPGDTWLAVEGKDYLRFVFSDAYRMGASMTRAFRRTVPAMQLVHIEQDVTTAVFPHTLLVELKGTVSDIGDVYKALFEHIPDEHFCIGPDDEGEGVLVRPRYAADATVAGREMAATGRIVTAIIDGKMLGFVQLAA